MTIQGKLGQTTFGGKWTKEKLDILEKYLNAYTTALKGEHFRLIYMDAFAGSGKIWLTDDGDNLSDINNFVKGSAERALSIKNKPFDQLIFIEKNTHRCAELESLCAKHTGRDIKIENSEANSFLSNLRTDWNHSRGVLFIDPYATQVEWSTIEIVAGFNSLDTWILFPVSAIARMLPRSRKPDDISDALVHRLTKVYGDDSWRQLYERNPQDDMFGQVNHERDAGVDGLIKIYKEKLSSLFGTRYLDKTRALKNSRNSILFEFMFCAGHPNGAGPAKRIAKYILEHL